MAWLIVRRMKLCFICTFKERTYWMSPTSMFHDTFGASLMPATPTRIIVLHWETLIASTTLRALSYPSPFLSPSSIPLSFHIGYLPFFPHPCDFGTGFIHCWSMLVRSICDLFPTLPVFDVTAQPFSDSLERNCKLRHVRLGIT